MKVADFDFELPEELIAQEPAPVRGGSRLMAIDRASGRITHLTFSDLPSLLRAGDLLVVNDTRVFPARLIGTRLPGGGAAECFLIRPAEPSRAQRADTWIALVHPGQRLREGSRMICSSRKGTHGCHAEITGRHFHGRRTVRLWTDDGSSVRDTIDAIGHVPLPPYIKRADEMSDRDRYQTVYARHRGSIAAPTAGLHFTPEILEALDAKGVERASVTLHVGYGTFQPIRVERVEQHEMEGGALRGRSRRRGAADEREEGEPAHHCGRHHDHAHARIADRVRGRRRVARLRGDRALHSSGPRVHAGLGADHEFPLAEILALDAGVGVCGARERSGRVSGGGRQPVSVL